MARRYSKKGYMSAVDLGSAAGLKTLSGPVSHGPCQSHVSVSQKPIF